MTKTRLSLCLALALAAAACTPAAAPAEDVAAMKPVMQSRWGTRVHKGCDFGRAVYVVDAAGGGAGVVVVDNAPECSQ